MAEPKPLEKIEVIGKAGSRAPFPIDKQRGLYFFISIDQFARLKAINDAYRNLRRGEAEPLEKIKIVGRGGIDGYRPFILKEHPGLYLCIFAEHLGRLEEVNLAYAALLAKKQEEAPEPIIEPTRPPEGLPAEIETAISAGEPTVIEPMPKIEELAPEVEAEAVPKPEEVREAEVKPPEEKGIYVYCVIPSPRERRSFGDLGIEGSGEVYTIVENGGLAAAVSNAPFKEYVLTEDNVMTHNRVIRRVMEEYPVAPMAFGMVFKNEETLKGVMKRARGDIKKALEVADGKVELGVKVIQPKEAVVEEDAFASEVKQLREIAFKSKLGRRFSKRLLLNAYYLVAKEKVHAFSEAIEKIQEKFKELKIQYSGPWPPFNFATIKIGRE